MFKLKDKVNGMEMRLRSLEKEVHDIHSNLLFGTRSEPKDAPSIDITTSRNILGQTAINMSIRNMGDLAWKNFSKELDELIKKYSE